MKIRSIENQGAHADEARLLELTRRLTERVKELKCMYGISRLFENEKLSPDEILQGVIDIVPPAWQFPEITCARIKTRTKEYISSNFKETKWSQIQNIKVNKKKFGTIEVYYLEERPVFDEGPFLSEERSLLLVIAERLGHAIERSITGSNVKFLYHREKELREKLQSEMRVRVDFTRKLIHELKTPLTALIATSNLLYDEIQEDRLRKLARYILDSANNLNNRIDELHDVIRGETGILQLNLRPVNIETLLKSLVEETRAMCQENNVLIELNVDNNVPGIYADPDRLRQVILNLINNAIKYAKEGHKINIFAARVNGYVQISVQDFGSGIPEERQARIFEPGYQQLHPDERAGGLGIGLALSKTLVELHGGKIWFKSKPGKGTVFFFNVPIKELNNAISES